MVYGFDVLKLRSLLVYENIVDIISLQNASQSLSSYFTL